MPESEDHRFGFVALAGPPNAGKSTLINRLVGEKVSIVSRRPQTTRHRVLGIRSEDHYQAVFVDTPGLHHDQKKNLNKMINRTALASVTDVDLVLFLIDHHGWNPSSEKALRQVARSETPIILVINKVDTLKDRTRLLPLIQRSSELHDFAEIIPLSALRLESDQTMRHDFLQTLVRYLPEGPPGFPADQVSDRSVRFQAAELVREQTFLMLGKELPYESAVEVTRFDDSDDALWEIDMIIWVEKPGQKAIVIGKGGKQLGAIGTKARLAMEKAFDVRVRLNLWVKQRQGWADNASMLRALGYGEE